MRKIVLLGAAAAGLALTAVSAHATEFKGTATEQTLTQAPNSGLVVISSPINSAFDFTLTADDLATKHKDEAKTTIKLFDLYTNETSLEGDDLNNIQDSVALTFNFTLPTPNSGPSTIDGDTTGQFQLFGLVQEGVLTWSDSTIDLYYGPSSLPVQEAAAGLLTITVNGGTFNEGLFGLDKGPKDGLTVSATFDWVQDPVLGAGVPEPASWTLMIGGFGLAGTMLRRRRASAVAA